MTSRLTITLTCTCCKKVPEGPGRRNGWYQVANNSLGDGDYLHVDLCSFTCIAEWAARKAGLPCPPWQLSVAGEPLAVTPYPVLTVSRIGRLRQRLRRGR
jgi:hypothetical protein